MKITKLSVLLGLSINFDPGLDLLSKPDSNSNTNENNTIINMNANIKYKLNFALIEVLVVKK